MNVSECMDALGAALATISGLRAYPYNADKVVPPAAVVDWPDTVEYDTTMSRGSDRMVFPVSVIVGRADERTSRDRLSAYANGSGTSSVKQVVEAYTTPAWDSIRVTGATFGSVTIAGATYLAVSFDVEIVG